jgi:AraC-like DNA-binding protein
MSKKNSNSYHRLPILDGLELLNAQQHTLDFPYHTHNTFNIALILNHTFNTKLTDKFLQAPIGTISITNPHEVHATPCDSKAGNSFFTFYVPPDVLKKINKGVDVFFEDKVIYDSDLFSNFYFLSQNFSLTTVDVEKKLTAAITLLVHHYAAKSEFKYKQRNLFSNFINEDAIHKFSLEDIAKRFELDKFKFLRLFKQETGLTPNNYVILKRIEKSKVLLQTNADLLDVAFDAGFYDAAHLCRHFKRFTGVTPQEYRTA